MLTAVLMFGHAYMRDVASVPPTLYFDGRDVTSKPSCTSATSLPSRAAPMRTRCRVSARYVLVVKHCSRVTTKRTGRPTRRAAIAIHGVRGCGPLLPNAPPT
jgi:hypothetical protein